MVELITGVIVLAIGIILFLVSRAFHPPVSQVLYYLGLALIIIGAIVITIAVAYAVMLIAPLAMGLLPI